MESERGREIETDRQTERVRERQRNKELDRMSGSWLTRERRERAGIEI